ncbi:MAG: glycosyltransferase [Solirubrobacteraceae bacterium]
MTPKVTEQRRAVLFVTPWYPLPDNPASGVFVREHALAAAQFANVAVLHLAGSNPERDTRLSLEELPDELLPTFRAWYRPVRHTGLLVEIDALRQAMRLLRRRSLQPDVVHAHTAGAAVPAALYARMCRLPLIVTEQWSIYLDADPSRFTKQAAMRTRWALHRAATVLPVGSALEAAMQQLAPRAHYQVIPNVVDCDLFHPPAERPAARPIRLIAVGLLSPEKCYPTLLRAVRHLLHDGVPLQLEIVGYGRDEQLIATMIREMGLVDHVLLSGYLPKTVLAERLREAHVFVHASAFETFGASVAEALASGLPVVSTRCGGPEDYVTPEDGCLVQVRDHLALAAGIRTTVARLDDLDARGIAARARARFSWETVGRELQSVYSRSVA